MIVRAGEPRPQTIDDLMSPALLARLDRLDVRSRKVFAGKLVGERRSKQRGRSVEFADYREYTPGDDIRFIDWNVYARLDRLFVRLFYEEQDLSLRLVVDASESMSAGWGAPLRAKTPETPRAGEAGETDAGAGADEAPKPSAERAPSKRMFALRLAMALGYIGLVNHNRVSVSVFRGPGRGIGRLDEVRGRRNVQRLGRFLLDEASIAGGQGEGGAAPAEGSGQRPGDGRGDALRGGDFASATRETASRRGKGVAVVISDFLFREGYEEGLRYLGAGLGREAGAGDSFDVYCLQVLAPGEIDPSTERGTSGGGLAGDLRLTDAESGASAEVTVSATLLKRYRAKLDEFVSGLASHCAARRMTHSLLRSDEDIASVVVNTLRRRGMVG